MFRNQLFSWLCQLVLILSICTTLSCTVNSDNINPATAILKRGTVLDDAALISEGINVKSTLINMMDSNWETLILQNKNSPRPISIKDYESYISSSKRIPLKLLPQTTFNWVASKVVLVGIFKNVIQVANNEISNQKDIVWIGTPTSNSIKFIEGKIVEYDAISGKLIESVSQKTIPVGIYVWCVWAYDAQGLNIIASSREIPFSITN